jgi:hypothetical protein
MSTSFDAKVERLCQKYYKKSPYGRPSVTPGVYFRCLLIGYFEGLNSERGIAWRTADSLSLRQFLPNTHRLQNGRQGARANSAPAELPGLELMSSAKLHQ